MNKNIFLYLLLSFQFFYIPSLVSASSTTTQIIIAPHFDDAALPLGGLLAQSYDNKLVVTVFAGKPENKKFRLWDKMSGFGSSDTAMAARAKENNTALAILNASSIDLGFLDGQYRGMKSNPILNADMENKIKIEIDNILKKGDKVEVYGPSYFGKKITHPDHLIVHNIFLNLVADPKYKDVDFYLYEDMPYMITYAKDATMSLISLLQSTHPFYDFTERDISLSQDDLIKKYESINAYTSQMKAFRRTGQPKSKAVVDFAKTHCKEGACEKVYKINPKRLSSDFTS